MRPQRKLTKEMEEFLGIREKEKMSYEDWIDSVNGKLGGK